MGNDTQANQITLREVQCLINKIIWDDESMRDKLKKDLKGVLASKYDVQLSDDLKVETIDLADKHKIYYTLPKQEKLSEKELDAIAGGAQAVEGTLKGGGAKGINIAGGGIHSEINVGGNFEVHGNFNQSLINEAVYTTNMSVVEVSTQISASVNIPTGT